MDSVAADAPGGGALSVENVVISTPTGSVIADVSGSGALSLKTAGRADVSAGKAESGAPNDLLLRDVSVGDGGRIDAGRITLAGTVGVGGGTLELVAARVPDALAPMVLA